MKRLKYLFVFLFIVVALPKTSGRYFENYDPASRVDFDEDRYKSRSQNVPVDLYEDSYRQNIPVYFITNSEPNIQRTNDQEPEDLFDNNGMIYITNPKTKMEKSDFSMYKVKVGRRNYDLSKRNRRKLMAMMNKELNRQLVAKANTIRRNNLKTEYDFNELVS